jgi:hypothetical protein
LVTGVGRLPILPIGPQLDKLPPNKLTTRGMVAQRIIYEKNILDKNLEFFLHSTEIFRPASATPVERRGRR